MLYGSSTGTAVPNSPVTGSIGVKLPSVRPSALLVTQSLVMSHDGTTCCGSRPTATVRMILKVAGSITVTLALRLLGTYTNGLWFLTVALVLPAACSL